MKLYEEIERAYHFRDISIRELNKRYEDRWNYKIKRLVEFLPCGQGIKKLKIISVSEVRIVIECMYHIVCPVTFENKGIEEFEIIIKPTFTDIKIKIKLKDPNKGDRKFYGSGVFLYKLFYDSLTQGMEGKIAK